MRSSRAGAEAVELPRAKDLDPSPGVFELELEAGVGKAGDVAAGTTPVWIYNGTSPGPLTGS